MPRKPDPGLEQHVLDAALRILDSEGPDALTMRRLAAESSTTTPTLYERFPSRAALEEALFLHVVAEISKRIEKCTSITEMARGYLKYISEHPHRLEMFGDAFGRRYAADAEQPLLDLLRRRLREEVDLTPARLEQLAVSIVLMVQGTQGAVSAAGPGTKAATVFTKAALESIEVLLQHATAKRS